MCHGGEEPGGGGSRGGGRPIARGGKSRTGTGRERGKRTPIHEEPPGFRSGARVVPQARRSVNPDALRSASVRFRRAGSGRASGAARFGAGLAGRRRSGGPRNVSILDVWRRSTTDRSSAGRGRRTNRSPHVPRSAGNRRPGARRREPPLDAGSCANGIASRSCFVGPRRLNDDAPNGARVCTGCVVPGFVLFCAGADLPRFPGRREVSARAVRTDAGARAYVGAHGREPVTGDRPGGTRTTFKIASGTRQAGNQSLDVQDAAVLRVR